MRDPGFHVMKSFPEFTQQDNAMNAVNASKFIIAMSEYLDAINANIQEVNAHLTQALDKEKALIAAFDAGILHAHYLSVHNIVTLMHRTIFSNSPVLTEVQLDQVLSIAHTQSAAVQEAQIEFDKLFQYYETLRSILLSKVEELKSS